MFLSDPNKNYQIRKNTMWFDNMRRNGGKKSYAGFSTAGLLESLICETPWDDYSTQHFLNLLNTAFFLLRKRC